MFTTYKSKGRPPKFDRGQAISTARAVFHSKGYDGAGVAELGEAMGIKPPSLYAAYGSKLQLFDLALDDYVDTCGGWMEEILGRDTPLPDLVKALFLEAGEQYTTDKYALGCMVLNSTHQSTDNSVCELAMRRFNATRNRVKSRMAGVAPEQRDSLIDYVMLVLHGLSASARAGMSKAAIRRAAKSAATGFSAQLL